MQIVGLIIGLVLQVYLFVLFARMILSWVPVLVQGWRPRGPILVICEVVYSITDPPLRLLRKVFKPVRIGAYAIDLAFMILLIMVTLLIWANRLIFL